MYCSSVSQRGPKRCDGSSDSWEDSSFSPSSYDSTTDGRLGDLHASETTTFSNLSARSDGDSDFSEFCAIQRKKRNKRLWEMLEHVLPPLDLSSSEDEVGRDVGRARKTSQKHNDKCAGSAGSNKVYIKSRLDYGTWLRRKNKELAEKAARERKEAKEKLAAAQERKRLAAAKYEEWCRAKSTMNVLSQKKSSDIFRKAATLTRVVDERESQMKVQQWEDRKRLQAEFQRRQRREEEARICQMQEERRRMSVQVWRKWSVEAVKKPKPAPLNRGIVTLCGSTPCFVNPDRWRGPLTGRDD